jgi:hypothetical protein
MVTIVFASILGLKLFSQQVNILEFKKLALAELQESSLDTRKYHEAIASERKSRNSIGKIKAVLYSQDASIGLFSDLHQSTKILKTSWIDSLKWNDSMDNDGRDTVHVVAKIFVNGQGKSDEIANDIEQFLASIRQSSNVAETVNTVISPVENNVMKFSFDIKLNQDSQILQ